MKKTVSYNIKKVLAGTMLVALPFAFGGCEKENTKPENSESHQIKEIIYNESINLDSITIQNYLNQNYNICLVPERQLMFSTMPASSLNKRAAKIRKYWGIAPNHISGNKSDTIYVTPEALAANAASFWSDTLHNTVLAR